MKITKVKVYPYKNKSRTGAVGVGLVVFEHQLLLSGLELYERNGKRFIKFPKNEFNKHDLCYCQPTSQSLNSLITNALFGAYDGLNRQPAQDDSTDTYFKAAAAEMLHDWQKQTLETAANNMDICAQAVGESTEVSDEVTSKDLDPAKEKEFYNVTREEQAINEASNVYKES